jgi:predicted nucleotidyltransferase
MVTRRQINAVARWIADRFRPQKVILFGSYAYGTPNHDSDVDLLVVMPVRGDVVRKAAEIRLSIWDAGLMPHSMDLLVRTPSQVRRRLAMGDSFMREILEKGKVLA